MNILNNIWPKSLRAKKSGTKVFSPKAMSIYLSEFLIFIASLCIHMYICR